MGKGTSDKPKFLRNRSSQQLFPELPQSPVMAVTENFFDFREGNTNVWDEDNLVAQLKKDTPRK